MVCFSTQEAADNVDVMVGECKSRLLARHALSSHPTTMSVDFKAAVEQEIARLQVIHPTPEDVPGCMRLLDDFLSCHGTPAHISCDWS